MKRLPNLRSCNWFFAGLLFLIFFGLLILMMYGKPGSFIFLNTYHPFLLNVFFINYTFIGDGIFALCLIALVLFYYKRKYQGIVLLLSFLISGLVAQVMKNIFNLPRPKLYFEAGQYLQYVDGVTLANHSSFPSGHTATAFAIATVFVLMMKNKKPQVLILIAAALVGYSRIYLAQHFLLDIIVGALIGSGSGILSVYLAMNIQLAMPFSRKVQRVKMQRFLTRPSTVQPT